MTARTPARRRWLRAWMRVYIRLLAAPDGTEDLLGALARERPARVLYLRTEPKVGDLIMVSGVIHAIAGALPSLVIDVVAAPLSAPVLANHPDVRRTYVFDRARSSTHPRLMLELRRARYHVVVDGRVDQPSEHTIVPMLMAAAGARYRVGARDGEAPAPRGLYTHEVTVDRTRHFVEQSAAVLKPFGVCGSEADLRPIIRLTNDEGERAEAIWAARRGDGPRLLVNVSADGAARMWGEDRYSDALLAILRRAPARVAVIGSPADQGRARRIADAAGVEAVPTPNLRDALALVASADVVWTPDTAISHAAAAFRTPAVVMFLPTPESFLPQPSDATVPYRSPARCVFSRDMTLASLDVDEVVEAVLAALGEVRA